MQHAMKALRNIGLGAGLMYLLDPDQGRRRRSLIRDKAVHATHRMGQAWEKTQEDLENRARGMVARGQGLMSPANAPDWVLAERARAEIGRVVRFPGSIHVAASDGHLTLSGPILAEEVDKMISRLSRVRGVRSVENRLEVHQSPEGIPGLQGQPRPREPRFELMQEYWSPSARLVTGVGGSLLALYGLQRGGLTGKTLGLAGLGLALRGATNMPMKRLVGIGAGRRAIDVQKAINIEEPVEEVYQFWSNFTNFPRFMAHVREVRDLGNGMSHWKVAGPAGVPIEWDAVTTKQIPNQVIAWKSVPDAAVKSAGIVHFEPNPAGGTRVTVQMSYNPLVGALGHAVASLMGADPKQAMDEDLVRLKSLLETGKTTAEGREVARDQLTGQRA